MDIQTEFNGPQVPLSRKRVFFASALVFAVSCAAAALFFLSAPGGFPSGIIVTVEEGQTLLGAAGMLKEQGVVRSSFILSNLVMLLDGERSVIAGDYYFKKPIGTIGVARAIGKGDFGMTAQKITIPEGTTLAEIAGSLDEKLPKFDAAEFLELTKDKEGYLFPDTYFLMPNATASTAAAVMEENFKTKLEPLSKQIAQSGRSLADIIIMASLVEEETRTPADRRLVAGILWKRIKLGMPLQVDAVFPYINGKNTYEVTARDLKIDSPYNTYLYPGLPIAPIANPGLDSIKAAIEPAESPYLYYLSDRAGAMHYAKTFEEHKRNRELYLNAGEE